MKIRKEETWKRGRQLSWWFIGGISLLFLLLYREVGFLGHFGYDDMWYARLAAQIASGTFELGNDHYAYRWSFIFPLALLYKILGISDSTSAIWPMIIHLATLLLIYRVTMTEKYWVRILSIVLFLFNPVNLLYADKLMPDGLVALSILAVLICVYKGRNESKDLITYSALGSIFIIIGVMAKLTIWLAAPVVIFWFFLDLVKSVRWQFWGMFAGFAVATLIIYLIIIWFLTGDPFSRMVAIQNNQYISDCRYDLQPTGVILRRVFVELWLEWLKSGLFIPLTLIVAGIINKSALSIPSKYVFWSVSGIILLLSANFMSISFADYVPMCPDPRHFLFVTPPLAIAGGYFFYRLLERKNVSIIVSGVFIILALASLYLDLVWPAITYLGAGLSFLPFLFFGKILSRHTVFMMALLLFTSALLLLPVKSVLYANQVDYRFQKAAIKPLLTNKGDQSLLLVTNEVQANIGTYWMGYDSSHIRFKSYDDLLDYELESFDSIYVVTNGMTRYLSGLEWDDLPEYVKQKPPGHDTIVFSPPVFIYSLSKNDLKRRKR